MNARDPRARRHTRHGDDGGPSRTGRAAASRALVASFIAAVALLQPRPSPAVVREDALIPLTRFPRETIVVETRSARRYTFDAWRADTPETREQGLMFVRSMRAEEAMIFVYDRPQRVGMWMKNTLIPLDMLFVSEAGCIVKVERETRPGSLKSIQSSDPVTLVVELKGGTARALGIEAGDRVVRPEARWPGTDTTCTRPG